jgi:group II intron reverse transcriptase/maturase
VEGRERQFTELLRGTMADMSGSEGISPRQQRIASLAREASERSFTSLNQYLDVEWLREAYRRTRKDGAVGVDGQTAANYEEHLEENLRELLERAKSGRYRAPAVRRVNIPKGDGSATRPIGVPTFEDKVLQRAVVMLLEPIYEQDFRDCSYGFRPGRSAHQGLESLWGQLMGHGGGWVVEVDIQGFFDTLDKAQLRAFLRRRVRDGVVLRLVGKWLQAGVLEEGSVRYPEAGTPQGGVISPLLANIYLHEVLDAWFERDVKPRLRGPAFLVRYADDAVFGLAYEEDARRVLEVLPKRFGKYGLTLHPKKTRLIDFRRPSLSGPKGDGERKGPGAFDFLGFTHHWGKSRRGSWVIKRTTAKNRFSRAVKQIGVWCRMHRHDALREQHEALTLKLRGHYGYYGITGNSRLLARLLTEVERRWRYWLNRRSQGKPWPWERFQRYLARIPLPPPRVVHSVYRHAANP